MIAIMIIVIRISGARRNLWRAPLLGRRKWNKMIIIYRMHGRTFYCKTMLIAG